MSDAALKELLEFIAIPSVSTDPAHTQDTRRAALWLQNKLGSLGLTTDLIETPRHPVVFAEDLRAGPSAPTVLVYGHYDVQPPDPLDEWVTPPFAPNIRDGFIYARGSSDDKGQLFAHIVALEQRLQRGPLAINLKFLLEGEEEIGSPNLAAVVDKHKDRFGCDVIVISDGAMFAPGVPTMTTGLRGLCYLELHATGASKDLHSGIYGGAVANPLNALASVIAGLKDQDGRITIPGLYDAVLPVPEAQRQAWAKLPFNEHEFANGVALDALPGEAGFSVLERLWARPTLDVNGIWGGFQGEGAKTVLPNKATAKISLRLVPNQSSQAVAALVKAHIEAIKIPGIKLEVRFLHGGEPVLLDANSRAAQAAKIALERSFPGKDIAFIRSGGTIPIVALFEEVLVAPVLLVDMGLPDDGAHGPNERFALQSFQDGIVMAGHLLETLASLR